MLLDKNFLEYYTSLQSEEPPCLADLRKGIQKSFDQDISVSHDTGRFLAMLVSLTKRRTIFEAGTFCGYSSSWMALGHPEAHITTCDINAGDNLRLAEKTWDTLGLRKRISFVHQDALEFLPNTPAPLFDMVFVDANKSAYKALTEKALPLLTPNGFFVFDNFFMRGHVLDKDNATGQAIHAFNAWLAEREDLYRVILPVGDGITIAAPKANWAKL